MRDANIELHAGPQRSSPSLSVDHFGCGPLLLIAVTIAVAAGIAVRAWFIFHDPITSDEAVVGLIAQQIQHGHTNAFVATQVVGGVEPYVVALFFWVFGQSAFALVLVPVTLSIAAALLVWRVALRLVRDPMLALLAGALTWAAPLASTYLSTVEGGYRGVTLVCGLLVLLFALRILDGEMRYREFVALGVAAGIGWWALSEIVYFFVPASLLLTAAAVRTPAGLRFGRWARKFGAGATAFCLGALPWIWANIQSNFASLDARRFAGSLSPNNTGYFGRLQVFFKDGLLLQLNLRRFDIGTLLFGVPGSSPFHRVLMGLLVAVALAVVVLCVVLCILSRKRAAAIGVAFVIYPFLVALQPGTWFWIDGRYTVYTGVFLALTAAIGAEEATRRLRQRNQRLVDRVPIPFQRAVFGIIVIAAIVLNLYGFHQSFGVSPMSFSMGWGNPDQPTLSTITALERSGIRTGYAGYWVAYKLDLLSDEQLAITVLGSDSDRSQSIDRQVHTSPDPAWLFVPPNEMAVAHPQFGARSEIQGPNGLTQTAFLAALRHDGIRYRIIDAGLIRAVVPNHPVHMTSVGITPTVRLTSAARLESIQGSSVASSVPIPR